MGCIGAGAIVVLLVFLVSQCSPSSEGNSAGGVDGAAQSEPAEPPLEVTATELFNAYQNNEASAQSYFGDRPLLVSGKVDKVTLNFMDEPVVGLVSPNQFMSVQASLAENAHAEAGNFNPGDKVRLLCEDVSEVAATPMLDDCRTAPADLKGEPVQWAD